MEDLSDFLSSQILQKAIFCRGPRTIEIYVWPFQKMLGLFGILPFRGTLVTNQ